MTKKKVVLVGVAVVALGMFFRLYNFRAGFEFGHDHDLYSWIAKDIVVNRHPRLVGQLTSVDGVFIGPLYYYLMAVSYWVGGMDPFSPVVVLTVLGLAAIGSVYLLGKTFWSKKAGLIIAILYATSWGIASYERWSVPTQPTLLWSIWYLFTCFKLLRGEVKYFWIYGVLLGLVYHIHIALAPLSILGPIAYALSSNKNKLLTVNFKVIVISGALFLASSSPFWLFELKHGFSQVKSVVKVSQKDMGEPTGWQKVNKVVAASSKELQVRLLEGWDWQQRVWLWPIIMIMAVWLVRRKGLTKRQAVIMGLWMVLILGSQFWSKRKVSEYYFSNLAPMAIIIVGLTGARIVDLKWGRAVVGGLVTAYILLNLNWIKARSISTESLLVKSQLVDAIRTDVVKQGYPCIGVNYIADFGSGVGFRYLFWYKGLELIKPGGDVPVYNIVVPAERSKDSQFRFGRYGLIMPEFKGEIDDGICRDKSRQLDPLLGYTD